MMQLLFAGLVIILIALLMMFLSRSQALQRFAALEFLLILFVTLASFWGMKEAQEFALEQYFSLCSAGLDEVRDYARELETGISEDAGMLWQAIGNDMDVLLSEALPETGTTQQPAGYLSFAVCERTAEENYSVKLFRQATEESLSQEECLDYIQKQGEQAIRLGTVICEKTDLNTAVMVYGGTGLIAPRYIYLTEVSLAPLQDLMQQMQKKYVMYGAGFTLAATLLLGLIIWLQQRPFHKLRKHLVGMAEGKEDWTFLEQERDPSWLESNEIRSFKNSLRQILSDVARTSYRQYRVLQGYYRFAPKQIEKIFGKNSILEVDASDSAHVTGTLAFVACPQHKAMGEREYLRKVNLEMEALGEKQQEYGGILLSGNSDLTSLQLLFQEETKKALQFGIDVVMNWEKEKKEQFFVLLHRTALIYGIAGNDQQALTYLISREMKMLEKYVERFRMAGIRMAVTDSVYELIKTETSARYIGYLDSEGLAFKVYEILDACPAGERQRRIHTKEKFEQALNLFYQEDYYLGRNLFTEVLKESPDDEVAKWYLFLCEKCLDAEHGKNVSGALFSD